MGERRLLGMCGGGFDLGCFLRCRLRGSIKALSIPVDRGGRERDGIGRCVREYGLQNLGASELGGGRSERSGL